MPRKSVRSGRKRPSFTVRIYPGEDGQFVAYCEELPGCVSQGKTLAEAHANIREAMVAYIETLSQLAAERHGRGRPSKPGRAVKVTRFTVELASA